jgi:hypothetical protein
MNDEGITQLEARVRDLEQQLAYEKSEREALQQIVLPPLKEVQKDLEQNIDYFTGRLEELKARPAGGSDDEAVTDIADIYRGMIQLLKWLDKTDERLDWLTGIVRNSLKREAKLMGIEACVG